MPESNLSSARSHLRLTVLASGSKGNSILVETPDGALLVDAGLSGRQLGMRLEEAGRNPGSLLGIILTHEHQDHAGACRVLAKKHGLPIYANELTWRALGLVRGDEHLWRKFETGGRIQVGDIEVESFSVPHDASDPVGLALSWRGCRIVVLTDLGYASGLVLERARGADVLIVEANHDPERLRKDVRRPWSVKQRIMARHGHLSNEAAAVLAAEVAGPNLRHVCLAHLSEDCNDPVLACGMVAEKLEAAGWSQVRVAAAFHDRMSETILVPER